MNHDLLGESAYCNVDGIKGLGTVCGYTYDDKYYIIGFYNDFGCVLAFNPKKVYIDDKYSKNCKSYRFSAVYKTTFFNENGKQLMFVNNDETITKVEENNN